MPPTPRARALAALAAPLLLSAAATPGPRPDTPTAGALAVVGRCVTQESARVKRPNGLPELFTYWQVDYRLRNDSDSTLTVAPEDVAATVGGRVSNSKVPAHAAPLDAAHSLVGPARMASTAELVTSADESRRCRERAVLRVWPDDGSPAPADPSADPDDKAAKPPMNTIRVAPGASLRVRLRLEHRHFLYGAYDALLGERPVELRLGPAVVRDTLPLDRERRAARPAVALPRPPAERMDTRHFVSAPDSLHLEAHAAGRHQYRFDDQPARHSTKMRLRFWYLIAPGSRGETRARVVQYRDAPTSWKVLGDGTVDEALTAVGRWAKFDHVFPVATEATSLALDFRIVGADIGEAWFDDITLEPVHPDPAGP